MKTKRVEPNFKASDYEDLAIINSIKSGNKDSFSLLYKKYHYRLDHKIRQFTKFNVEEAKDLKMEIFQKVYENIHKYEKHYTFNSWISKVAHNYLLDYYRKNKVEGIRINSMSIDQAINPETPHGQQLELPEYMAPEQLSSMEQLERQAKLCVIYKAIEKLPDLAIEKLPKEKKDLFKKFHLDGKTPMEISEELNLSLNDVEDHLKSSYTRYDQGTLEKQIMEMYYIDDLSYQEIARRLKLKLGTMKVTLKRAKEKLKDCINMRSAMIEVGNIYSIDDLDIDRIYKLNRIES